MNILQIFLAIGGLSLLVILHETGHYVAARFFGMRVLRYSIGFGPTLWRYQPKGSPTVFQVGAIPLLAYVHIAGMNPQEDVDAKDPGLYANQSLWARMVTIAAGPAANYLTASLLAFGLALWGWPEDAPSRPMQVAQIAAGSPAARAGIEVGDIVVRADGKTVKDVEDLIAITAPRVGQATEYVVRRGSVERRTMITPKTQDGRGIIGVTAKTVRRHTPLGFKAALWLAVEFPVRMTAAQLSGIAQLIRNRSTEGITGPIGMGKMVAEQAGQGLPEFLSMLMLLSVALGMFNLLPFPALDGGRLVFLGYEAITQRRPNEKLEAMVHTFGLLFLLSMLVLVTFRDMMG